MKRARTGKKRPGRWVRYQYLKLLRLNDSPKRIAGGFALGVAIGVLPSFGLGIIIAVFAAGLLKVNRVSAVVGTLVVNPWTSTFFWALSYVTGSLVLGENLGETLKLVEAVKSHSDLWKNILAHRLLAPYIVGNLLITVAFTSLSYLVALYGVTAYRRAKRERLLRKSGG